MARSATADPSAEPQAGGWDADRGGAGPFVGGTIDGGASMTSASMTARGLTRKVVDSAMSRPDPLIRGVLLIVVASLAAVIVFACGLAVAVPIVNGEAEQLLLANDLAERRSYNADVSMGKWYQLISVSLGFTAVDDWDTLVANLTTSVNDYEAAHRQLLAVAQSINGELSQFEQQRTWDVCSWAVELFICSATERMSASDFVEFTIFHLRQLAALPTGAIAIRADPANPTLVTGYHQSLYILVPNLDLIAMALDNARDISSRELAAGLTNKLGLMTVVLVVIAVATFAVATIGTTLLVAQMGRLRHLVLSSIAQVPRKLLKLMALQTEQAQAAFATAIGADSGDDDAIMQDVDGGTPRGAAAPDLVEGQGTARGKAAHHGAASQRQKHAAEHLRTVHVSASPAGIAARCCGGRDRKPSRRKVSDGSCFVPRTSCAITAPLALTAVWVAVILVMINDMFRGVVSDAARSEKLHQYAGATSALRGQIEVALLLNSEQRVLALQEARTNSTAVLQALGAVLNGDPTTSFGARLPGLAESGRDESKALFDILVHDSCLAVPTNSWEHGRCREIHDSFGLKGLHSFTTAMLDDGVQARAIFDEANTTDTRGIPILLASGDIFKIIPAMRRYSAKSAMGEMLLRHIVNITSVAATAKISATWSSLQLVLGLFTGAFVLIVWLWALPAVGRIVAVRAALLTLLRSLPEEAILATPAVSDVVALLAVVYGMAQASRAMKSVVRQAEVRARSASPAAARRGLESDTLLANGGGGEAAGRDAHSRDELQMWSGLLSPVSGGSADDRPPAHPAQKKDAPLTVVTEDEGAGVSRPDAKRSPDDGTGRLVTGDDDTDIIAGYGGDGATPVSADNDQML